MSTVALPTLHSQKLQLLRVQSEIDQLQKHIMMLKQQQKHERRSVELYREKAQDAVQRKLRVGEIKRLRARDGTDEQTRTQMLRVKNKKERETRRKEIGTILKACYLVRMDEAMEVRKMSEKHQEKIREIKGEVLDQNKGKHQKVKQLTNVSRLRYIDYWRGRLTKQSQQHDKSSNKVREIKQQKLTYLNKLKQQEAMLTHKVMKVHKYSEESKIEYMSVLNIPVKEVTMAVRASMDSPNRAVTRQEEVESPIITERYHNKTSESNSPPKIPKTHLNEAKLRIIMSELKKQERTQISENSGAADGI